MCVCPVFAGVLKITFNLRTVRANEIKLPEKKIEKKNKTDTKNNQKIEKVVQWLFPAATATPSMFVVSTEIVLLWPRIFRV